ncbi:MAG: type II toxin-antitoxin system VapB family antitoxin [Actinomycetia bacterium]|nr:type II toxin-antitoxin system VapB family antitoxin [Actinomycetes bacterium]
MGRTNIDIDDELIKAVMIRYHLDTNREAVDYALRALIGKPFAMNQIADMFGSIPDFDVPQDLPPEQI